ncbi:MFS transporter [Paenibacillus sp. 1P07SE]|uniref:MFS transporter n=1 Tax=Paenibacillus sp. 1P07SE TaxID=3132209 RepID=UPI0039A6127E
MVYYFLIFYAVIYMGNAVYGTYMPVYFQSAGLSPSQIGILLSLGPLVAVLAQPVWGAVGDRARTKNRVLAVLLAGSGVAMLMFPFSTAFVYLLLMVCLFTFFQTSIFALSDTITLEQLDKQSRWTFGPIRLGGTFGFAAMSVFFGWLATRDVSYMFPVYALIMLAGLLLLIRLPRVSGGRAPGSTERVWVLLKNRKLVTYMGISLVLHITMGYYYSFFPVYFRDLGGDNGLLGWSMLISSLSEIPFLLLAGRIFKRVRISTVLLVAGLASAARWFICSLTDSAIWLLPTQLLHGLIFIVLTVTLAMYINQVAPKSLKASGQTLNGLLTLGVARIIGSFFGGFASEAYGMRAVFNACGWIALACCLYTAFILLRERREEAVQPG